MSRTTKPAGKPLALWCPCCRGKLVSRGQLIKTIRVKAGFVRRHMVCEHCDVRVQLHVNRISE